MDKTTTKKKPRKKIEPVPTVSEREEISARVEARLDAMRATIAGMESCQVGRSGVKSRAAHLRIRMSKFRSVYNAAWYVRYFQHGSEERRLQAIDTFWLALLVEIEKTKDREALIYAIADSITCSPYGVPWES